jgi:hypothetical protein
MEIATNNSVGSYLCRVYVTATEFKDKGLESFTMDVSKRCPTISGKIIVFIILDKLLFWKKDILLLFP